MILKRCVVFMRRFCANGYNVIGRYHEEIKVRDRQVYVSAEMKKGILILLNIV